MYCTLPSQEVSNRIAMLISNHCACIVCPLSSSLVELVPTMNYERNTSLMVNSEIVLRIELLPLADPTLPNRYIN